MVSFGLLIVGGVGAVLSAAGLLYNIICVPLMRKIPVPRDAPYFWPAALMMLGASTVLQLALLVICVILCGGASAGAFALVAWSCAVCAYILLMQAVSRVAPRPIRDSIASAAGVANTGLFMIIITAYPVWGPALAVILHWAR